MNKMPSGYKNPSKFEKEEYDSWKNELKNW